MSIEELANGKYRVRWYTPDGQHPSRTLPTRTAAEAFYADVTTNQADVPRAMTLKALADEWWAVAEGSIKPRTAERYLAHLRIIERHLAKSRVTDLNYERLQRFVFELQKTYRPRTVVHCYAVLALVLKHGERLGLIEKVPPKPILPRITRAELTIPTKDDVERLAAASDARFHTAILLAGYGALRQGEVLGLTRGDIHLDEGWLLVRRSRNKTTGALESTKTDKARRVYMPQRLADALAAHLDEYPGEARDLVFPQSSSSFQKSWVRARTIAGLPSVRFHDLRHSAASLYIHAGWSPTQVAAQLGHADPAMTLRTYSHLWPQSYDDAIKKINDHLNRPA